MLDYHTIYLSLTSFSSFQLPETKNRTFDEIAALFRPIQMNDSGGPAAFPDYGCNLANVGPMPGDLGPMTPGSLNTPALDSSLEAALIQHQQHQHQHQQQQQLPNGVGVDSAASGADAQIRTTMREGWPFESPEAEQRYQTCRQAAPRYNMESLFCDFSRTASRAGAPPINSRTQF